MSRFKLIVISTGSTGYIGGSVLDGVVKAYPDLEITALLRSVPDEFSSRYPNIKIVKGDFDAKEVIEKAAYEADIVLRKYRSMAPIHPSFDLLCQVSRNPALTMSRPGQH